MASGFKREYRRKHVCTCKYCRPSNTKWWKRLAHKSARRKGKQEIKEQI